jgi:hypothetical protein
VTMPNPDEKDIVDETAAVVERLRELAAFLRSSRAPVIGLPGETELRHALAAAQAADIIELLSRERGTVQEGWQDISTAPKDGTWFLICRDDEGFDSYEIGCYEPLTHDRFEPAEGGLYRKVPVKILDHRGFNNFHRATHWMPLPAPPAVKEGEGV